MSLLLKTIAPEDVRVFIERNGSTALTGRGLQGAWIHFMRSQTATGEKTSTIERNWLRIKGGTGETLADLWNSYLFSKGFTSGNLNDRMRAFMRGGTQT